jgi:hypothetical protein
MRSTLAENIQSRGSRVHWPGVHPTWRARGGAVGAALPLATPLVDSEVLDRLDHAGLLFASIESEG